MINDPDVIWCLDKMGIYDGVVDINTALYRGPWSQNEGCENPKETPYSNNNV